MADNVGINTGAGATVATDDIGGVHWQKIKLAFGGDDSATSVTSSAPLPVEIFDVAGTLNSDVTAIKTAVEILDNAISGSEMQVDIVGITPDLMLGTDFSSVFGSSSLITATQADNLVNTTDTINVSALGYVFDGTTWDRLRGDATNGVLVNLGTNNDVTLATLPDTSGGDLAAIKTAVEVIDNAISGSEMQVDIVADGAGLATSANQDTMITALQLIDDAIFTDDAAFTVASSKVMAIGAMLDDTATDSVNEGDIGVVRMSSDRRLLVDAQLVGQDANITVDLGTTDNAVLDSIQTAVETIDNAISGSEMQVDIVGITPDLMLGTDFSAVFGSTDMAYLEDDAAPANPTGLANMLIRDDAASSLVTTDGDWVAQRATAYGAGYVQVIDSSGNFIDTFGGSGGTATTDDGAFTAGSGQGTPAMGFFSADTVDSGDVGVLAMDASRRLLVSIEADNVGIGGGTQYAEDGALGSTPTGTLALARRDDELSALTPVEGDAVGLRVDDLGGLYVSTKSYEDSNNSTTTPLTGGATFTGVATETLHYKTITIIIFADANSAASGVSLQWSPDGTNWNHTATYTYTANGDMSLGASVRARYFRLVYTNGGSAQSTFRCYTYMHPTEASHNIRPLEYTLTGQESSEIVRSVLAAETGTGYQNIGATNGGNLKVSVSEISDGLDVGAGNAGGETQRVSIATDDVNLSAIKTAVEVIDNAIAGSEMQVDIVSGNVTNTGTFAVQVDGDALTALQLIDDVIFTDDAAFTPATSKVAAIGAMFDDTATDAVDEGDIGALRMTNRRALYTTFETPAGDSPWDDTNDALQVNVVAGGGTGGTSVTDDDDFTAATTALNPIGGVYESSPTSVTDGDIGMVGITATRALKVDLASQGGGSLLTEGSHSHDAADGGRPMKIGGRAQEPTAQPDEVADEDRVDALFDRNGYQRVRGDFDPKYADINDASSGDNTIIAAAGAGKRIAVWSVAVVSDGTVDVRFEDGAAGTAFTGQIPLQAREGFTYSAGGLVPLWVGAANTLLNLELSAAINVHGHVSYTVMDD